MINKTLKTILQDTDYVHGYLPAGETWYSATSAHQYGLLIPSGNSDFTAPRDTSLPVFIRGGYIVPQQRPGLTVADTRQNEFLILVALSIISINKFFK